MGFQHQTDIDPAGDSVESDGTDANVSVALPTNSLGKIPLRILVSLEGAGDASWNLTNGAGAVTRVNGVMMNKQHYMTVRSAGQTHLNHLTTAGSTIHITPLNP